MALAVSAGCSALVLAIFLITVAFGNRALEIAGLKTDDPLDAILFSSGVGFAVLQLLLGIIGLVAGLTIRSVLALLVLLGIAGWRGWKSLFRLCRESANDLSDIFQSGISKTLGLGILFFLSLEALLSTAPLTGSDAMAYHFTVPLLQIGRPEQPIFWLTTSFYTGLGHELIALGLVLGGDRLGLLLIFFGGCLTAVALFQMARKWMPVEWALTAALTFLMTPMVFWQISTSGSPDIWMGFYTVLAALAVGQARGESTRRWLLLASVYAGAGASLKYTGWIVPVVIILFVLWLTKSILWAALCSAAALAIGVFPLMRNFLWTGDPFFLFLTRWIGKVPLNEFGLESLQKAAHSSRVFHAAVSHFVFPGGDDPKRRGLWRGTLFWSHRFGLCSTAHLLQLEVAARVGGRGAKRRHAPRQCVYVANSQILAARFSSRSGAGFFRSWP